MKRGKSMVLVLESERPGNHLLNNAMTIASRFSSALTVIASKLRDVPLTEKFWKSKKWEDADFKIVALGMPANLGLRISEEIYRTEHDLLILEKAENEWKTKVMEASTTPILMISGTHFYSDVPFDSILVPMSGENRTCSALEWAIETGNELHLPVDILHVSESSEGKSAVDFVSFDRSVIGRMIDHFHHEYPRLIEQFISEASPYSSLSERKVIRRFCHCGGDALGGILKELKRKERPLVVLEWKGSFQTGRAMTIKELLERIKSPVLLIREKGAGAATLKVGSKFAA